ncbi:hypothetical protein MKX03_023387 [Papaver bracteatum]|nr:hypothetical protein MKX03_023387 [Papaver bracteatum]
METARTVEQLNASNYETWRLYVQNYLKRQDLWGIIDGTNDDKFKTWMSKNAVALQVIKLSCGTEMLSHIIHEDSAKAAWEKLATANYNFVQSAKETKGPAIPEQIDEDNNYTLHVALYKALDKNDWESAKDYLKANPNGVSAQITSTGDTALHVAALSGRVQLVKTLLELMPKEALEIQCHLGTTALVLTAVEGSTNIAKLMVEKNSNLLRIKNSHNFLPLLVSAINGNEDLMRYLYSVTPKEELDPKVGVNGATFLTALIEADIYDVALDALQRYPESATARDCVGMTVIRALAEKPSAFPSGNQYGFLQQFIYRFIRVEIDYLFREAETSQHSIQIGSDLNSRNFIKVAEHGRVWESLARLVPGIRKIYEKKVIHVQVMELLKIICPQISKLSVQQLQDSGVYDAIFDTTNLGITEYFKELISSSPHLIYSCNSDKGEIGLFQEAVLARQHNIYNFISQMRVKNDRATVISHKSTSAEQHVPSCWIFLAPPSQLEKSVWCCFTNAKGDTMVPEGEAWMKETSQACMIVSTLIATVMFTAAFTVPGGNNGDTGTPIFSKEGLSILLKSLPQKLILGLASLFISIVTMMTAFDSISWAYIPVTLLASIPVLLFGFLQFPLFVDIVLSTYGPAFFLIRNIRTKKIED